MTNIIKNGLEEVNTSIGQLLEAINNKADLDASNISGSSFESFIENKFNEILASIDYVIETKLPTEEDPSWYRLYKSGWVEQGGAFIQSTDGNYRNITVTFPKSFATENYNVQVTTKWYSDTGNGTNYYNNPTTTSVVINVCGYGGNWYACGMSAI